MESKSAPSLPIDPSFLALFSSTTASTNPSLRFVERNLPFDQSRSHVNVDHNQGLKIRHLVKHDLFHFLLRRRLITLMTLLLVIWTAMVIVFASLYFVSDSSNVESSTCSLFGDNGPLSFQGAFAFSLQTCTTVGYTLPLGSNAFFENCPGLQVLIFFQSIWSMLFNAFLLAFLYSRVGRAELRSAQLMFSKRAIVSITPEGQIRFQVRAFDVDARHPVAEAKCRMYVIPKKQPIARSLRIIKPNDELGAPLFLSLPTVIMHAIDHYSALHPYVDSPVETAGLTLRQADSITSSREENVCRVCGNSYGTVDRLKCHIATSKQSEISAGYPPEGTHQEFAEEEIRHMGVKPVTLDELKDHFAQNVSEVIVTASALDPLTSGAFQSLQSYQFHEIIWDKDATFEPCVYIIDAKAKLGIDLERFHQIKLLSSSWRDDSHTTRRSRRSYNRSRSVSMRVFDSFVPPNESTKNNNPSIIR